MISGWQSDPVSVARGDFDVYLMRHGETTWNRAKVVQGSNPCTDLTFDGIDMARDSSAALARAGIRFDRVYSSPYRRAVQTAEIMSAAENLEIRRDDRLRERCCGDAEGRRFVDNADFLRLMVGSKAVESESAVKDRAMDFLENELRTLDGMGVRCVLCVTHTLILRVIEAHLSGGAISREWLPNCCFLVLRCHEGRFSIVGKSKVFYDVEKFKARPQTKRVARISTDELVSAEVADKVCARVVDGRSNIVRLEFCQPIGETGLAAAVRRLESIPEFYLDFCASDDDFVEKCLAVFADAKIDRSRLMVTTDGKAEFFKERYPEVRIVSDI